MKPTEKDIETAYEIGEWLWDIKEKASFHHESLPICELKKKIVEALTEARREALHSKEVEDLLKTLDDIAERCELEPDELTTLKKESESIKKDFKVMREIAIDLINPDKGAQEDWTDKHIDDELKRRRGKT